MTNELLFTEKYRPHKVEDTILPDGLKTTFQNFVDQSSVPNLILAGSSGVGKTTIAKAMLDQLDMDYIVINGSMRGNIDTLRNDISQYASSSSLTGGRKYVILDEADYINPNSTQPALRNFMEEFSDNCGFILTCNFLNRIIEPLQSRCAVVHFSLEAQDKPKIAKEMFERACQILDSEEIKYHKQTVAEIVRKYFPDMRRVLNELQRYSATGSIDAGILRGSEINNTISDVISKMKEKDFSGVRKWVAANSDVDSADIFRHLYDNCSKVVTKATIPELVLVLAEYQYRAAFVADPEINIAACLAEIMVKVEFV